MFKVECFKLNVVILIAVYLSVIIQKVSKLLDVIMLYVIMLNAVALISHII
jgi:hypothetical protein